YHSSPSGVLSTSSVKVVLAPPASTVYVPASSPSTSSGTTCSNGTRPGWHSASISRSVSKSMRKVLPSRSTIAFSISTQPSNSVPVTTALTCTGNDSMISASTLSTITSASSSCPAGACPPQPTSAPASTTSASTVRTRLTISV